MKNSNNIFNLRLLYVEDEDMIRDEIRQFLSSKVSELICAEDGLDGLEKYRQFKPDLIVTDVMMPKIDGLSMIKEIKKEYGNIPAIVMTAFNKSDTKMEDIKELDIDVVLSKPIRLRNLVEAIRTVIEKRGLNG